MVFPEDLLLGTDEERKVNRYVISGYEYWLEEVDWLGGEEFRLPSLLELEFLIEDIEYVDLDSYSPTLWSRDSDRTGRSRGAGRQ